jgi:RNA-directed DNA polymerase
MLLEYEGRWACMSRGFWVRKDGAAGIDGQTADDYGATPEENLRSLLDRAKSGDRYKAPPVRWVYIPKGDGLAPAGGVSFSLCR